METTPLPHFMEDREVSTPPSWWFEKNVKIAKKKQSAVLACFDFAIRAIFETLSVEFWVMGGTLLGLKRHGGFIDHDDDIDVCIGEEDVNHIRDFVNQSFDGKVVLFREKCLYKNVPFSQLVFFPEDPQNIVMIDIWVRREQVFFDPKEFLLEDEIFPLTTSTFHGLSVKIPNKWEPYLDRVYGKDWRDYVYVYIHQNTFSLKNVYKLSLSRYNELIESYGIEECKIDKNVLEKLEEKGLLLNSY